MVFLIFEGTNDCADKKSYLDRCPTWAKQGACGNDPRFMSDKCQKSCNLCGNIPNFFSNWLSIFWFNFSHYEDFGQWNYICIISG